MQLRTELENIKLRSKSPFTTKVWLPLVMGVIVAAALYATTLGVSLYDKFGPRLIAALVLLMGCLFAYAFWRRGKRLIDKGKVVRAEVTSALSLPKDMRRITVDFTVGDRMTSKTFTMTSFFGDPVNELGYLYVVALEDEPKESEPLYMFASDHQHAVEIVSGGRGL